MLPVMGADKKKYIRVTRHIVNLPMILLHRESRLISGIKIIS
jgi:hypothetical protein